MNNQSLRPTLSFLVLASVALFGSLAPAPAVRAMSADSSGYAIVLPWVVHTVNFKTLVSVENNSAGPVTLSLYYVGEFWSDNPRRLSCSDTLANPVPQTFGLRVDADSVLEFDLSALLAQKCKGVVTALSLGNRGTLTIMANGAVPALISAAARVERLAGPSPGVPTFGYSQDGLPLGALEASKHVVAGLRSGPTLRTDCLVGNFNDKSGAGNLYRLTVRDAIGGMIGSTILGVNPWAAEMVTDVFATVGAPGLVVDGATVEIEPAANASLPPMVASCRVFGAANPLFFGTILRVGKIFEPLDPLRHRKVQVGSTPGVSSFIFDPVVGRSLHTLFLRAPDLVQCAVDTGQLIVVVKAPNGQFVAGGFPSTLEFFTGHRGQVAGGDSGAWGLEVEADPRNPPTTRIPYQLTCVAGNGVSQLDRLP